MSRLRIVVDVVKHNQVIVYRALKVNRFVAHSSKKNRVASFFFRGRDKSQASLMLGLNNRAEDYKTLSFIVKCLAKALSCLSSQTTIKDECLLPGY